MPHSSTLDADLVRDLFDVLATGGLRVEARPLEGHAGSWDGPAGLIVLNCDLPPDQQAAALAEGLAAMARWANPLPDPDAPVRPRLRVIRGGVR